LKSCHEIFFSNQQRNHRNFLEFLQNQQQQNGVVRGPFDTADAVADRFFARVEAKRPEAFVFVSLYPKAEAPLFRYEEAWIVGWLSDADFRERSVYVPKGSEMGGGGLSFRAMRDVDLSQLKPIEDLVSASLLRPRDDLPRPLNVKKDGGDER
jgi:hypothetical protein